LQRDDAEYVIHEHPLAEARRCKQRAEGFQRGGTQHCNSSIIKQERSDKSDAIPDNIRR
jgi:hypothetical protein